MKNNLRKAHYEQLRYYVNRWNGDYYGKRAQFLRRHDLICKFIDDGIANAPEKAIAKRKTKETQS